MGGDKDKDAPSTAKAPATPPTDMLWLVAGNRGTKNEKDRRWTAYAHHSNPGFVWRMNNTAYNAKAPSQHEDSPLCKLSVLSSAVASLGSLPTAEGATLVFFWHGDPDTPGPFPGYTAFLMSGADWTQYDKDVDKIDKDSNWNSYFCFFKWSTRLKNLHYKKVVDAIKALDKVKRVILLGCRLGKDSDPDGIRDFTADVQKEVWAYTGYTHTFAKAHDNVDRLRIIQVHDPKYKSSKGVKVKAKVKPTDPGYEEVDLDVPKGMLPGWQMRGYFESGKVMVDTYENEPSPTISSWDGTYSTGPLGPEPNLKKTFL